MGVQLTDLKRISRRSNTVNVVERCNSENILGELLRFKGFALQKFINLRIDRVGTECHFRVAQASSLLSDRQNSCATRVLTNLRETYRLSWFC
jgi:hypothetical protein